MNYNKKTQKKRILIVINKTPKQFIIIIKHKKHILIIINKTQKQFIITIKHKKKHI